MTTPKAHRLIRKLFTLLVLVCCLTVLANSSGADASKRKATRQICCSICTGEPTDPGACKYGCNPDC
jgi:hypothetical protein